jgi:hypothetical protein
MRREAEPGEEENGVFSSFYRRFPGEKFSKKREKASSFAQQT